MKEQIKILLDAAQWRLHAAQDAYTEEYSYTIVRDLECLVNSLNEAYNYAVEIGELK